MGNFTGIYAFLCEFAPLIIAAFFSKKSTCVCKCFIENYYQTVNDVTSLCSDAMLRYIVPK